MTTKIEQDIKDTTDRIQSRQDDISNELDSLDVKIKTFTNWAWIFVYAGLVLSVFALIYFLVTNTECGFALNLLGDFLAGSVASIWSLAGLFFIYVAFLGQKQQLLHQQLEIMYSQLEVKYTRFELEGQKKELIEQNKTLRQQRFENTFFQLLSLHHQIVNAMDLRSGNTVSQQGRDVFKTRYSLLRNALRNSNSSDIDTINETYLKYYKQWQTDFGHYFRNLYHIVKLIHNSDLLNKTEKYKYTSILRAQLSSDELTMLFYNCLSENGIEKFKPLVEKYHFLKNMGPTDLVDIKHMDYYDKSAFEKIK